MCQNLFNTYSKYKSANSLCECLQLDRDVKVIKCNNCDEVDNDCNCHNLHWTGNSYERKFQTSNFVMTSVVMTCSCYRDPQLSSNQASFLIKYLVMNEFLYNGSEWELDRTR